MILLFAAEAPAVPGPQAGDWWNPFNWASLAHELGLGGFMALVLLGCCAWLVWRSIKSPQQSNRRLVNAIRHLSAAGDARHARLEQTLHKFAEIGRAIAAKDAVDVAGLCNAVHEILNAPMPEQRMIDLDEDNGL